MDLEEKVKAKYDEAKGEVKEKLGEHIDDPELEGRGHLDQAKGKAREAWGEVKDAAAKGKEAVTDN
ncbi:MAG TPA: CsbD family protein [Actinomycetota bacterium]|nr:CsbD family protein [Actinomycetota bacterium]